MTTPNTSDEKLMAAAAKLASAAQNLEFLVNLLVQHAGQGSGLGGALTSLTNPAGSTVPKTAAGGIGGFAETILPRQAADAKAMAGVFSAGKDLWNSLFGGGRDKQTTSNIPAGKPEGPAGMQFPIPLPVIIVGGVGGAGQQQAGKAARHLDELEHVDPFSNDIASILTGNSNLEANKAAKAAYDQHMADFHTNWLNDPNAPKIGSNDYNLQHSDAQQAAGGAARKAWQGSWSGGEAAAGGAAEAGVAGSAAAVLGPIAAIAATGKALWDFKSQVDASTRAQLEMNHQFAEYSANMGRVFAVAEAKDAYRTSEVGNRAAASAQFLSDMNQDRKDSGTKELDLLVMKLGNYLSGIEEGMLKVVAWLPNKVAEWINKQLEDGTEEQVGNVAAAIQEGGRKAEERDRRQEVLLRAIEQNSRRR